MHNAAYAALGIPFVMAAGHVKAEDLPDAMRGMSALNMRGLAVTMPHKVSIVKLLDEVDPVAQKIGAVNTVVNKDGRLTGYNTDWLGILRPLERETALDDKSVAILGAGGAAQAAIYACMSAGATVTVFNRSVEKAKTLTAALGPKVLPLNNAHDLSAYDIIINTTSVGMGDARGESPIPGSSIMKHHIVFETIYAPATTKLLHLSQEVGAKTIPGSAMFLEQGIAQFELHTGVKAPKAEMERILRASLERNS
jgi:shikimate dehydrogenase